MVSKYKKYNYKVVLIIVALLILVTVGYLYKERYLNCIVNNFSLCFQSQRHVSENGEFTFRYPKDYPISFKSGRDLVSQYGFDNTYDEWVNFSNEFYPNAGGDRLGSVIVEKKTDLNNVHEYGNKTLSDYEKLPEKLKGIPPKVEYLKIAGEDAVRVSLSQQPSSFNPPSDTYVLIHNGNLYSIGFDYNDYYHKLPIEHYEQGKKLILSTFTLK